MYATLYHYLQMTPDEQAKVTEIDLAVADPEDFWRIPPAHRKSTGAKEGNWANEPL